MPSEHANIDVANHKRPSLVMVQSMLKLCLR